MRLTKVAGDTLLSALPYYCSLTILGKARRQKLMCRTGSAGVGSIGVCSRRTQKGVAVSPEILWECARVASSDFQSLEAEKKPGPSGEVGDKKSMNRPTG
jgi:hypothetical protein